MKRCPTPRLLAVMAALCITLTAVSAFAQFQTGNIYGKVQARDGAVLPGVTVTLSGVGAPMNTVTDGSGNFRFINLSPGMYSIKAELAGYGSAVRSGVGVRVGTSSDVTMSLSPSVAESITVTAEAPLLDMRKTGTSTNVSRVELEKIPTARDPWMILQGTPGITVDRINVGGTQSGQQSVYMGKGSRGAAGNIGSDNTWNIDGVNITDMGATGSSPTYYDFDSFEELQITTGGSDPRIQTAGVQLNMVTKRGTNDFKGSGRYLYVPGSYSSEAEVPTEATGYLSLTNKVNYVRDYGAEIGGPVWRDRLWFWAARGDQSISTWQSLARPAPAVFIPDDTVLKNHNLKLNAQLFSSNSFVAAYTYGDKFRNARDISATRPFEASWKQTGPSKIYKLEDTQIFGSSFYMTGMWSKVDGGFGLFANGGVGESAPSAWQDNTFVWRNSYLTYQTVRPQKQYRLDNSKFFDLGGMNHELKFGFGYRHTPVNSVTAWPGAAHGYWSYATTGNSATICANQSLASNCAIATVVRDPRRAYDEKYRDLYVGDTVLIGNLTIQGGLRWDRQQTNTSALNVLANPLLSSPLNLPCIATLTSPACVAGTDGVRRINAQLPTIDYPGGPDTLKWDSISPRIGLTYALGQDRRTLVRASYNRYASQMGSIISTSSPLAYTFFQFYGVDANGDNTIQRGELARVRTFGGLNPLNPTAVSGSQRVDYDMKVPTTDEFILGFERELMSDLSIGINYTFRNYNDFIAYRYEKTQGAGDFYSQADYMPATRTTAGVTTPVTTGGTFTLRDPITGATLNTFTVPSRQVYMLRPGVGTPNFNVITNRPDYSQKYSGLELSATKRMSNRWMMRFNTSWNDHTEDCGDESFANPTPTLYTLGASVNGGGAACGGGQFAAQSAASGAFGNVFIHSKWNFNLNGVYVAPWDINIGANLIARQGYPMPFRETVTGLPGGAVTVQLAPMGDQRFPNVYQLDLRLAKDFRIMDRAGLSLSIDVFNAPNQRTVLQRNTLVLQNGASLASGYRITEIQAPRVFRFGGKVTF